MNFFPFSPQQFSPFFGSFGGFPGFGGTPFGQFNSPWNNQWSTPFSSQWNSQFGPFGGFNSGPSNFGAFSPVGNWWNNGFNNGFNGGFNFGAGQFAGFPFGQFNSGNWNNSFGNWSQPAFWNNWTNAVPFAFPFNWGFTPVNTESGNGENNNQNVPFGFAGFTPFGFVNPFNTNQQTQAA